MSNPTVNADKLDLKDEYVCWIDIMGTKNIMSESIQKAANFILKFHSCIIESTNEEKGVRCYPLMDGVFVTSSNFKTIKKVIDKIFNQLAALFLQEEKNAHRFIIKGSLAYGYVAHGSNISNEICSSIASSENYKNTIMLGIPMIQAIKSETKAPPFGIYIHESARKYKGLQGKHYSWSFSGPLKIDKVDLQGKIINYFKWCDQFIEYQEMDKHKIQLYIQQTNEYFTSRMQKDDK